MSWEGLRWWLEHARQGIIDDPLARAYVDARVSPAVARLLDEVASRGDGAIDLSASPSLRALCAEGPVERRSAVWALLRHMEDHASSRTAAHGPRVLAYAIERLLVDQQLDHDDLERLLRALRTAYPLTQEVPVVVDVVERSITDQRLSLTSALVGLVAALRDALPVRARGLRHRLQRLLSGRPERDRGP
jgi:hypothetical protein